MKKRKIKKKAEPPPFFLILRTELRIPFESFKVTPIMERITFIMNSLPKKENGYDIQIATDSKSGRKMTELLGQFGESSTIELPLSSGVLLPFGQISLFGDCFFTKDSSMLNLRASTMSR